MLEKVYELRHIFLAISIAILLLSPIFLLLTPPTVSNTLYYADNSWDVFVPGMGYVLYGIAFLLLILSSFILFLLDIKKTSIYLSIIFVLLSGISFYFASSTYISLSKDEISYRTLFSKGKQTYNWEEVEKAFYHINHSDKAFSEYEFFFTDGNRMKLTDNRHVQVWGSSIRSKVYVENIDDE